MALPNRQSKSPQHKSEQQVQNWSFDDLFKVLAVVNMQHYPDSTTESIVRETTPHLVSAMAYDSNGNVEYIGKTTPGTSKATAGWQIKKFSYTGSNVTDIQYSDGDIEFDNIWNNRESLSYS